MGSKNTGFATAIVIALLVAGCGGGGGGGNSAGASTGTPSTNAPAGTVTITPKGPITGVAIVDDSLTTAVLEGTWQAVNLAAGSAVYLKVADASGTFQMPAVQLAPAGGTFRYELALKNAWAGHRAGQLEITACRDMACAQTYGAPVRVDYQLDIAGLGEWETLGGNAAHTSSVPTRIDPLRLKVAWEWTAPLMAGAVESWVGRPATTTGSLVVLAGSTMGDGTERGIVLNQFNEDTGTLRSSVPISDDIRAAAPGSDGRLAYLTRFGGDAVVVAYDGMGSEVFRYRQATDPMASTLAPSHREGTLYFFAGFNGDEVHAADARTGARLWAKPRVGLQSATPTVDADYVYYQAASGGFGTIEMLDRRTGNHVASILDPNSDGTRPVGSNIVALGSRGNLIARSFRARSATRLSSFSIAQRQWEWSTTYAYSQFFAVLNGTLYAIRSTGGTPVLDAIDETNGQVLWSWTVPATDNQSLQYGNMLATHGMVFFGTESSGSADSWVWAVDTATRQLVWRTAGAGYIVMSGNRTIYLVSGPAGGIMNHVRALRMQ